METDSTVSGETMEDVLRGLWPLDAKLTAERAAAVSPFNARVAPLFLRREDAK